MTEHEEYADSTWLNRNILNSTSLMAPGTERYLAHLLYTHLAWCLAYSRHWVSSGYVNQTTRKMKSGNGSRGRN